MGVLIKINIIFLKYPQLFMGFYDKIHNFD